MQWKDHKVSSFKYSELTSKQVELKIVGSSLKKSLPSKTAAGTPVAGKEYLHITARNTEDNAMPSVRGICATDWRLDQLLSSCGLKKAPQEPIDLIGKIFNATVVHHVAPNGIDFIDVSQYK